MGEKSDEEKFGKRCICGHFMVEHAWGLKGADKLGYLFEGYVRIPQEDRGVCSKCLCPKYNKRSWRSKPKNYDPK